MVEIELVQEGTDTARGRQEQIFNFFQHNHYHLFLQTTGSFRETTEFQQMKIKKIAVLLLNKMVRAVTMMKKNSVVWQAKMMMIYLKLWKIQTNLGGLPGKEAEKVGPILIKKNFKLSLSRWSRRNDPRSEATMLRWMGLIQSYCFGKDSQGTFNST